MPIYPGRSPRSNLRWTISSPRGRKSIRPSGSRRPREHRKTAEQKRAAAPAHRPADKYRQGLVADLFDSYMTLRGDDLEARGFKRVADTILAIAGISFRITDRDLATLRGQWSGE